MGFPAAVVVWLGRFEGEEESSQSPFPVSVCFFLFSLFFSFVSFLECVVERQSMRELGRDACGTWVW